MRYDQDIIPAADFDTPGKVAWVMRADSVL